MNNLDLDHIAVNTNDIKESVSWYVDKFGAEIEYIDETWALLAIGKTKLALTIPDQHPAHTAFRVQSIEDLGPDYREHRDGSCYVYINDPSGNVIELIYWRNDGTEKAQEG
tara:strand:- start:118 stop:450 length:333 start_codon:yes stop_codon:yes gene_type:complete